MDYKLAINVIAEILSKMFINGNKSVQTNKSSQSSTVEEKQTKRSLDKTKILDKVRSHLFHLVENCGISIESIVIGLIYYDKLICKKALDFSSESVFDYFLACIAIGLKFNNDYYTINYLIASSKLLKMKYDAIEFFILFQLDYKLLLECDAFDKYIKFLIIKIQKRIEKEARKKMENENNKSKYIINGYKNNDEEISKNGSSFQENKSIKDNIDTLADNNNTNNKKYRNKDI